MHSFSNIFKHSFSLLLYVCGFWYCVTDVFTSLVPLSLVLSSVLALAVYFFRIPKPRRSDLEKFVGRENSIESNGNNNVAMRMVAHRGAGLDAPENSLKAFELCADKDCKFVEFDVTLTKDGVPIVFHDESLERVANSDKTIADNNWVDVKNVDIASKHAYSDQFKNTHIPTLDQTVQQLLHSNQNMFIDIKDNDLRMVPVIIDLFKKYPQLRHRAVVSSFYPAVIYMVRRNNPEIMCSMAYRPYYYSHESYSQAYGPGQRRSNKFHQHYFNCFKDTLHTWLFPRFTYYLLGLSIVLMHKDCLSGKDLNDWRKKGIKVAVWTVNHPAEKQYFMRTLKCTYLTDTLTGEGLLHLPVQ